MTAIRFLSSDVSSADVPAPACPRSRQTPMPTAASRTRPAADQNRIPLAMVKGVIREVLMTGGVAVAVTAAGVASVGARSGASTAGAAPLVIRLVRRTACTPRDD